MGVQRDKIGRFPIAWLCVACTLSCASGQNAAVRQALAAMQRGDFLSAERQLRDDIAAHPGDAFALSLLGVALDNQKRMSEADGFHRRAVDLAPDSAEVLNNYAAHQAFAGNVQDSETLYRRVIAIDPS